MSEEEAIDLLKKNPRDATAFEVLYGLHKRRVYSICLKMTCNAAEAEDQCQETFLQLFRKIHTYKGNAQFSTWLHRVAVNVCIRHFRNLDTASEVPFPEKESKPHTKGTPSKDIERRDLALIGTIDRLHLERAINNLAPGYRTIFTLREVHGYEHSEMAEILGCTIGNCKSQLNHGKRKLREFLQAK